MKNKLLALLAKNNFDGEKKNFIRSEISDDQVHIYISGVIDQDYGVAAHFLRDALEAADKKPVRLHINSPGGDVFEARALQAAIVAYHGEIVASIEGCCASAATYLAMACDRVEMMDGSMLMIHNSWSIAVGDKKDMQETADLLEKIDSTIAADYVKKTGASPEKVKAMMDATTWFGANEALEFKFVDEIFDNTRGKSEPPKTWDLAVYPNAPSKPDLPDVDGSDLISKSIEQQVQRNHNRVRLLCSD